MGLFSKRKAKIRCGLVVDIGSSSVVISIVASNPTKEHPDVIWSRREYVTRQPGDSDSENAQALMTTLLQAMLYIDTEGQKALKEKLPGHSPTVMQVSVAAPWAYTITKNINYTDKEPFIVTYEMVNELVQAAQQKTLEDLQANEVTESLGLTIMSRATTDVIVNGYVTKEPLQQSATSLSVSHVTTVTQEALMDTIKEIKQKSIPRAEMRSYSFILMYYAIIRELFDKMTDFCLVDVTFEATEIGVVRDGRLQYCTHIPVGIMTLARAVAGHGKTPTAEVHTAMRNEKIRERLFEANPRLKEKFDSVISEYKQKLQSLFMETGDALAIPKNMFVHTELYTEDLFQKIISSAAQQTTKVEHVVYGISRELLTKQYEQEARDRIWKSSVESSVLLSAQFFHNLNRGYELDQF